MRKFRLPLGEEVNNLEQEVRMILPGIQTLFGFQLIVVFSESFRTLLTLTETWLHLFSLFLIAVSGILVAAPAAYHRVARHHVSEHFIEVGSRFLTLALVPLALGTCLDFYLVARIVSGSTTMAGGLSLGLLLLYAGLWLVYPKMMNKKKGPEGPSS